MEFRQTTWMRNAITEERVCDFAFFSGLRALCGSIAFFQWSHLWGGMESRQTTWMRNAITEERVCDFAFFSGFRALCGSIAFFQWSHLWGGMESRQTTWTRNAIPRHIAYSMPLPIRTFARSEKSPDFAAKVGRLWTP